MANSSGAAAVPTPTTRTCGTMHVHERLLRTDPQYARLRIVSENHHFEFHRRRGAGARAGITVIPVVVHVVHHTAAQNISDEQIASQITVLNQDFRKTNPDIARIPVPFRPLAADARVEFVLADRDPDGGATSGITRTQTSAASFTDDDRVKSAATGGVDAWPSDRYLNIWVCPLDSGLLGYAQFPGGSPTTDGVVILHSAFGTTGTAAVPFNLGRTTTHEVGHWLNLRHIWGDDGGGCNGDDFVADTPNQADSNTRKPSFPHVTCNNGPNGDMFMNYMDYVDDDTMFMFTAGQVERMQACLDGDRPTLGTQRDLPSLKFRDDVAPPKSKVLDDFPKRKFSDDGGSLTKRDDIASTKFIDDGGKLKFRDDVKQPGFDKPFGDGFAGGGFGGFGSSGFGGGGFGRGRWTARGVPFVLATPHHSNAWASTFPAAAESQQRALTEQLLQMEAALSQYAQADVQGLLGDADREQADALYAEYEALLAEASSAFGG